MIKFLQGCVLAIVLFGLMQVGFGQDVDRRFDSIMRDLNHRNTNEPKPWTFDKQPSILQVVNREPFGNPAISGRAEIPAHLLPEITDGPAVQQSTVVEGYYEEVGAERFTFSSAFERWFSPPGGDFSSVSNNAGCCDEWQTFYGCENCCRDLGLNPWTGHKPRPNCPRGWRLHPNKVSPCQGCGGCPRCGGASQHPTWFSKPW